MKVLCCIDAVYILIVTTCLEYINLSPIKNILSNIVIICIISADLIDCGYLPLTILFHLLISEIHRVNITNYSVV